MSTDAPTGAVTADDTTGRAAAAPRHLLDFRMAPPASTSGR